MAAVSPPLCPQFEGELLPLGLGVAKKLVSGFESGVKKQHTLESARPQ
jgi:hypothetical protein